MAQKTSESNANSLSRIVEKEPLSSLADVDSHHSPRVSLVLKIQRLFRSELDSAAFAGHERLESVARRGGGGGGIVGVGRERTFAADGGGRRGGEVVLDPFLRVEKGRGARGELQEVSSAGKVDERELLRLTTSAWWVPSDPLTFGKSTTRALSCGKGSARERKKSRRCDEPDAEPSERGVDLSRTDPFPRANQLAVEVLSAWWIVTCERVAKRAVSFGAAQHERLVAAQDGHVARLIALTIIPSQLDDILQVLDGRYGSKRSATGRRLAVQVAVLVEVAERGEEHLSVAVAVSENERRSADAS